MINIQNKDVTKTTQEILQEEKYSGKFILGIRRALLSKWQRDGFLKDRRDNHETWARFCLLEIFWLEIIQELRAFGLKSEAILEVYEYAFAKADQVLLDTTEQILLEEKSFVLEVEKDGNSLIREVTVSNQLFESSQPKNHIRIHLDSIVEKSIKWLFVYPDLEWAQGLTRDEVQGVLILMNQKFNSFKCTGSSNIEIDNNATEVVELIKHQDYNSLEIILTNGSIFSVARKRKTSL
ncbi:MAG: hypothetical protein AB8F74_16305 [Saprospiraceae bacterium]